MEERIKITTEYQHNLTPVTYRYVPIPKKRIQQAKTAAKFLGETVHSEFPFVGAISLPPLLLLLSFIILALLISLLSLSLLYV